MRNRAAHVAALAASFQPANAAMSSARSITGVREKCICSMPVLPSAISATARASAWSVYHLATLLSGVCGRCESDFTQREVAPFGEPLGERGRFTRGEELLA